MPPCHQEGKLSSDEGTFCDLGDSALIVPGQHDHLGIPAYHLPHWANTQRLGLISNLPVFYGICGALLILGPVTILTVASLKRQVKDMEEDGKHKLWEMDWNDVIEDDGCNKKPEKRVEMHIVHL